MPCCSPRPLLIDYATGVVELDELALGLTNLKAMVLWLTKLRMTSNFAKPMLVR